MNSFSTATEDIVELLDRFGESVMFAVALVESWLREQLALLGVQSQGQTIILTAATVLLLLGAGRFFAGFIRLTIVCILVLFGLRIAIPGIGS